MANNPNPSRITAALWYFAESCLAMQPGTENGGTFADKPGYHNTRNNLVNQGRTNDYSIRLAADKAGPGDKTAAFDWTFPDAQSGRYGTIVKYGQRVRAAFHSRDPRTRGWREVLIQADADSNAEGYDFTSWSERTPDSSHLWHGHFSVLRQYLNDMTVMNGMLSILWGESLETWRAGRSRYGGTGEGPVAATGGNKRMILGVYYAPDGSQRWVWSDGNLFSEIPGTKDDWLLNARRATASRFAEHRNEADFYREVGRPVADLIPKPVVFDVAAIARELAGNAEFIEAIRSGLSSVDPEEILRVAGDRLAGR